MKTLLMILVSIFMLGCTSIEYVYDHPATGEHKSLTVKTYGKEVKNFNILRTADVFGMTIGSTTNNDIFGSIATIIQEYNNPVGIDK